jgi:hypothetical protein
MATFSTLLGLKLNDPTDPFLLSDFVSNWNILDAAPGAFICTSSSRPTWGSSQAGRMIFMTDYKQLSYWDGSAWQDLRDNAPVFYNGSYINTSMSAGSSPTFTVLSFTTPRACSLAVWLTATYNCSNQKNQDLYQKILYDGTDEHGAYREQVRFSGNSSDSGATAGTNATSMAVVSSVTAGSHHLGLQVDMGSHYTASVTMVGVKIMAMIATYSGSNVL